MGRWINVRMTGWTDEWTEGRVIWMDGFATKDTDIHS
jgi:hypothetical protein